MIGSINQTANVNSSLPTSVQTSMPAAAAVQLNTSNSSQASCSISSNLISLSTTIQQFESIRKWLAKNQKKVR